MLFYSSPHDAAKIGGLHLHYNGSNKIKKNASVFTDHNFCTIPWFKKEKRKCADIYLSADAVHVFNEDSSSPPGATVESLLQEVFNP